MSSETWTEPARARRNPAQGPAPASPPEDHSDALQPWQLFTLAGLIGATVVVFVSRGHTPAGIVLLSLTIFAAAVVGIAAWRTLGPLAMPNDPNATEILGGRTRAALEREKTLVLRSIKELEFDRAMGKVADRDFHEMSARLRARAARLIRQLDAGSNYREQIAREIERRLGGPDKVRPAGTQVAARAQSSAGGTLSGPAEGAAASSSAGRTLSSPAERAAASSSVGGTVSGSADVNPVPPLKCPHCGTENDSDSQFCKRCGASLEPSE